MRLHMPVYEHEATERFPGKKLSLQAGGIPEVLVHSLYLSHSLLPHIRQCHPASVVTQPVLWVGGVSR